MHTQQLSPQTDNCKQILKSRQHALLGISPFNSYYIEDSIRELVMWANQSFDDFNLFIPDTLPVHNFIAMGYDIGKAVKKTKKQISYLRKNALRSGQLRWRMV